MQSLKFKVAVVTDLARNPKLGGQNWLGKQRLNCNTSSSNRSFRIVACGADTNGGGAERLGTNQMYALLKQQMDAAAKSEDYKEAARLRDSLKMLEDGEPVLRLKKLLKEAIDDERFEDAVKYRNELNEIDPHSLLDCSSDSTTLFYEINTVNEPLQTYHALQIFRHHSLLSGIRVQVRSVYIESRSEPSKGQYFFAYRIRVTNNSDRPVQLLRRHWIISDANERIEHVRGIGVIGEQPVILPNTSFEYSSACPLSTSSGRMEGDFEMKYVDMIGSRTINVSIAPFALSTVDEGGLGF